MTIQRSRGVQPRLAVEDLKNAPLGAIAVMW